MTPQRRISATEADRLRADVECLREVVEAMAKFDGRNNNAALKKMARDALAKIAPREAGQMTPQRRIQLDTFRYFRKVWDRPASYHLARVRHDAEWQARLASFFWLLTEGVPLDGAVPSLEFKGIPWRT